MFNINFRKILGSGIILVLVIIVFSTPVFAIDSKMQMTGESFSNVCTRADESWVSFCNGYIQAVVDSIRDKDGVCFPKGTSRIDLVTITEKEINASRELQIMNSHDALLLVLCYYFPCK